MRVKRGVTSRHRHNKIKKQTKGMQHVRRASIKLGRQAVTRSLQYQYRDRRNKKRNLRSLWITRINAAARSSGVSYSNLINGLNKSKISIDRKILAELAATEPKAFQAVIEKIK